MIFTLCCLFHKENIKYKTYRKGTEKNKAIEICLNNIESLKKSYEFCLNNNILSYRISSDLFPFADLYENLPFKELPYNTNENLILSMHPGQYINMGSPNSEVIKNSVKDIKYHLKLSKYLNNNEINIHIGGVYNNKEETKKRFIKNMLSNFNREELNKITIENDELNFHVLDTLEVCEELKIRPVFDIHHHRCHQMKEYLNITEEEIFLKYKKLWSKNYQRIHLSNPKPEIGYISASKSRPHSDLIYDFPEWLKKYNDIIIDVEAKYKEIAIFELINKLKNN